MRTFIPLVVVLLAGGNAQSMPKEPRLKGPARLDAMRAARTPPFDNKLLTDGRHRRDFVFIGYGTRDRRLTLVRENVFPPKTSGINSSNSLKITHRRRVPFTPEEKAIVKAGGKVKPRFVIDHVGWGQLVNAKDPKVIGEARAKGRVGKYVVIRGKGGPPIVTAENIDKEHLLAVPLTNDGRQPTHLHDVAAGKEHHLGGMVRGMLQTGSRLYGEAANNWQAHINLEQGVTVPILHVHGRNSGKANENWKAVLRNPANGYHRISSKLRRYRLYARSTSGSDASWPIVAVAKANINPRNLTAGHDKLLGKMILAVYQAAEQHGIRRGQIQVAREDSRLVVRVVSPKKKPEAANAPDPEI